MGAIDEQNKRLEKLERKCAIYDDLFEELASRIVEYNIPDKKGKALGFITRYNAPTKTADIVAFSNRFSGGVLELTDVPRYKPNHELEPEEQKRDKTFEFLFDVSDLVGVYNKLPEKGAEVVSPAAS